MKNYKNPSRSGNAKVINTRTGTVRGIEYQFNHSAVLSPATAAYIREWKHGYYREFAPIERKPSDIDPRFQKELKKVLLNAGEHPRECVDSLRQNERGYGYNPRDKRSDEIMGLMAQDIRRGRYGSTGKMSWQSLGSRFSLFK